MLNLVRIKFLSMRIKIIEPLIPYRI
jgi:hypothetical protein